MNEQRIYCMYQVKKEDPEKAVKHRFIRQILPAAPFG